ncbi:MAG: hypothetical protein FWG98_05695 [Candidatus Cloacimonetes bacterium]|nr:hypothetical protein [Candidatus Cloacimonadota bacterium]
MVDTEDFLKIPTGDMLRISSRQDSSQNQYEQQKQKREKNQKNNDDLNSIEDLDIDELIDFGRLVFKNRNIEMKLFVRLKKEMLLNQIAKQDNQESATDLEEINENSNDSQETNENQEAQNLDTKSLPPSVDTELTLEKMANLLDLYTVFYKCVIEESKILNDDEIDQFDIILKQKDEILNQIDEVIKEINFKLFEKFPTKNAKRIKANEILSDIHKVINEIMTQEDKNSVELQSLKERMKLNMTKQEKGAKAISQYGQPNFKSHFIDKKT